VGASRVHDLLCMRLTLLLIRHLKNSECRVYRPSVKLRVRTPGGDRFYYPDLQVACVHIVGQPDFLESPRLIMEVLSPTSEARDRDEKATAYQWIPSLEELALVAHDASCIEIRRRRCDWAPEACGAHERFRLESIGIELSVGEVYSGVDEPSWTTGIPLLSVDPRTGPV
jgi:Uma2 family endonuclease